MVTSDEEIKNLLIHWEQGGVSQIAMDFEGEFNLHCYGEHLCLIQIFDGRDFYLVDPLYADEVASRENAQVQGKPFAPFCNFSAPPLTAEGLRLLLESEQVEKLWFDCASDGELVWKKFGIRLTKVYDLFRVAKVLGLVGPGLAGNLAALTERFVTKVSSLDTSDTLGAIDGGRRLSKKHLQQTNWMSRPLSAPQLNYALEDVAHLFALKEALDEQVGVKKLGKQVAATMIGLPHLRQEVIPGYTKLPGYKRLTPAQQVYLQHFFEARDTVARQLNKPPYQVLDKHLLVRLAQKAPLIEGQLVAELGTRSVIARLLVPLMEKANLVAQGTVERSSSQYQF